jgi:hypothetical protein
MTTSSKTQRLVDIVAYLVDRHVDAVPNRSDGVPGRDSHRPTLMSRRWLNRVGFFLFTGLGRALSGPAWI